MELPVASAATTSLRRAFLPRPGFIGALRYAGRERRYIKKVGPAKITAKFDLKPPPYPLNALEPVMSQETLQCHWGKHHRAYVDNLNRQIEETDLEEKSLEDIIVTSYNKGDILPAFNNAAQVWNHDFFWESIKPGGGGVPSGDLLRLIERDFGSFPKFVDRFTAAAATQFGSGWAWLVYKEDRLDVENALNPRPSEKDNKLVIVKSPNAVNPLIWNYHPLLAIDVWEHAYFLDFQNRRREYISMFMDKLVSWETVSSRLEKAKARVAEREEKMLGGRRLKYYRRKYDSDSDAEADSQ